MLKQYFFLIIIPFFLIPAYAYNSGFQPVYQPTTPPGGVANIHDIGNVTSIGCALGQFLSVNASAIWDCASGGSGEINTASSSGVGFSLVLPKVGVDLPFRGIFCAGDLSCSSNATDVRISYIDPPGGVGNATILNDLGDVFTAPTFGEVLYFDGNTWVDHILILQQDIGDVVITLAERGDFLWYDGTDWIDKVFSIDSITCGAGQFVNLINNQTGETSCGTPTSSGFTKIVSSPATTVKILSSNQSNTAVIKTLTQGQGITLTNGSQAVTIATNFKTNTVTCSGTDKFSAYSNTTGLFTCSTDTSGSGATSLGANVTQTNPTRDSLVFTIPLTANSGNSISGVLTATSTVSGTAVRAMANVTTVATRGYCEWVTHATTSTSEIDWLVMNTILTGRATNNGATLWIAGANVAMPINFDCSVTTGATPGDLRIFFTPEVTGATTSVKAGSYYIKTP